MKVHTSNYAIHGFTSSVSESQLAELARAHGIPFIIDLGSGTLVDLEQYGLPHEPTPREAIAAGADLVTFSGDKLLGGPQCGLIVGDPKLVARVKKNPIKRALRVDKATLAALTATLTLYGDPERLVRELPTLRLLTRAQRDIEAQAKRLLPVLTRALDGRAAVEVVSCSSQIGSGALPVDSLPSSAISITARGKRKGALAQAYAVAFRQLPTAVIGRIKDGALLFDLRCLEDEGRFVAQLRELKLEQP
jgi:L-seryl-tRNA(Ser) seleniumtransferase